jgi:hypothetical protein
MVDVTTDLFCACAAWAYLMAMHEGKHLDSEYVRRLAYEYYERELRGEKADR